MSKEVKIKICMICDKEISGKGVVYITGSYYGSTLCSSYECLLEYAKLIAKRIVAAEKDAAASRGQLAALKSQLRRLGKKGSRSERG